MSESHRCRCEHALRPGDAWDPRTWACNARHVRGDSRGCWIRIQHQISLQFAGGGASQRCARHLRVIGGSHDDRECDRAGKVHSQVARCWDEYATATRIDTCPTMAFEDTISGIPSRSQSISEVALGRQGSEGRTAARMGRESDRCKFAHSDKKKTSGRHKPAHSQGSADKLPRRERSLRSGALQEPYGASLRLRA